MQAKMDSDLSKQIIVGEIKLDEMNNGNYKYFSQQENLLLEKYLYLIIFILRMEES
jgi:hypothetical protein